MRVQKIRTAAAAGVLVLSSCGGGAAADGVDVQVGAARTYYVSPRGSDTNPGSVDEPWRTIQKAADTLGPGDTAVLLDGNYEEGMVQFTRSGTQSDRITVRAQNKWGAVVRSTSGCDPAFSIRASYITVQGLRFSVSENNGGCGSYTSTNVAIRAWEEMNPRPSQPDSGHVGFIADGIKVDADSARSEGVKSNQDFTVIQNSEFGNSIELFNSKNSVIRNNVVNGQNLWGISIFVKGGVRNAQVYNNVIYNKNRNGYGIYLGGVTADPWHFDETARFEAYHSVAYNNVVVNESGGSNMRALILAGALNSAFFNNVVVGGSLAMMEGGPESGPRAATTNPRFENNIVICHASGPALTGSYLGTLTIGNNNFAGCSDAPAQANPVTGDPLLLNRSSDWRLRAGSPALNAGSVITFIGFDGMPIEVSRDRNGVARTAPWDLGVYEQSDQ